MNILSSPEIEKAIVKKTLKPWDMAKNFLILPVVLGLLLASPYLLRPLAAPDNPPYFSLLATASLLVSAYIAYRGIKLCYTVNERIDGKSFLERYVLLAVPPFLSLLLIILPVGIILWIAASLNQGPFQLLRANFGLIAYAAAPILTIIYFTLLRLSFKRLGKLMKK